jgi:phosphonopyruvate decarboxylase
LDARYEREDVLRAVLDGVDEAVVIGTTGHTSRQLFALGDRDRNVYLSGSMGHADAFGLGVSIDHPDLEVIVLDGDGAALMHLGNLATIGAFGGRGYRHIILDNAAHATTGGQPTVSPGVSFVDLAMALGYAAAASSTEFSTIGEAIAWLRGTSGPALLHAPIVATTRTNLPRVGVAPPDQKLRLRKTITRSAGAAGSRRRVAGQ